MNSIPNRTPDTNEGKSYLLAAIDGIRCAFPLAAVVRVLRAAAPTPVADCSGILGLINYHGVIIPLIDVWAMLHLPPREIDPDDVLIIMRSDQRTFALPVSTVERVVELPDARIEEAADLHPGLTGLLGIVAADKGMVFIHDVNAFFTGAADKIQNTLDQQVALNSRENA